MHMQSTMHFFMFMHLPLVMCLPDYNINQVAQYNINLCSYLDPDVDSIVTTYFYLRRHAPKHPGASRVLIKLNYLKAINVGMIDSNFAMCYLNRCILIIQNNNPNYFNSYYLDDTECILIIVSSLFLCISHFVPLILYPALKCLVCDYSNYICIHKLLESMVYIVKMEFNKMCSYVITICHKV